MASFFDEISNNRWRSLLLMLIFGIFFAFIVFLFIVFLGGGLFGFGIGIAIILIYAAISYHMGYKAVLKFSGSKEADPKQYPLLFEVVGGLAAAAEIPTPKIYIVNDQNPNAFAAGKNRKVSTISVTTGLLATMNRQELEGVIGHEISHIANNDVQLMTIAIIFAGIIGIIAAFARSFLFFGFGGRGGRNNFGIIMLLGLAIGLLAPFFALLIRLAISRRREYMADANGARITRDPGSLASALKKIQAYNASPNARNVMHANEVNCSMYFSNPFRKQSLYNLFSTHPPIEERIKKLETMY